MGEPPAPAKPDAHPDKASPAYTIDVIHLKDGRTFEGFVIREVKDLLFYEVVADDVTGDMLFNRDDIDRIEQRSIPVESTDLDVIHLKNGRAFVGHLVHEFDGRVFFDIVIGKATVSKKYRREDIDRIDRRDPPDLPPDAPRVAIITLGDERQGDTMGVYITAEALGRSIDAIEALPIDDRPEVVVLNVSSGGGWHDACMELAQLIRKRLVPDYRVVAWSDYTCYSVMLPVLACDEVVLRPDAFMGTHEYFPGPSPLPPDEHQAWLRRRMNETISFAEQMGRPRLLLTAMFWPKDVSVDFDEDGGVTWRNDLEGEHIVAESQDWFHLSIGAKDALRLKLIDGVADTRADLAEALGIAPFRVVCPEADRIQFEHRVNMRRDEAKLREHAVMHSRAVQLLSVRGTDRAHWIAAAERHLAEVERVLARSPELALFADLHINPETARADFEERKDKSAE